MKLVNNMLWMASGVGVGMMASKYSKDIKKMMKKGTKAMGKLESGMQKNMKSN